MTPEQASEIAEAALHTEAHGRLGSPRARLVVYAENPDQPRLAWATRVGHARTSRIWVTYVDAHTGEVLATEADSWSATGAVFPVSPAKGELETVTSCIGSECDGLAQTLESSFPCTTLIALNGASVE